MNQINVVQEMDEFKKLLSYSKNIGFFFGAGSSCAFGLPNIYKLTEDVESMLNSSLKPHFLNLKYSLSDLHTRTNISVEDILNYVRQIREITGEREDREYDGVNGRVAQLLDEQICKKIFDVIQAKERAADITELRKFFAWLDITNRSNVKEIFTTNYDLLLEKAMEDNRIPYFDGFVGSYEPFFWPESIEKSASNNDSTFNWIRLWKIHGSLNWEFRKDSLSDSFKIVRNGKVDEPENELVVYPSKEKYNLSRKQPFIAYFDRLKNYLLQGERLIIFSGYSFSDQHINEIIFNGLRQNPRLYAICMCFSDEQVDFMEPNAITHLNLCVMGPQKMITNGKLYQWKYDDSIGNASESNLYWNKGEDRFILGDFKKLSAFLIANSGKKKSIEEAVHGK
ncbi:SIR2 family protein [Cohnella sp. REN36]|uniref:SIR2 family NAD-dependent protein deacylase n=1 Tax=Cohnella sp. REN36 TaxID=2887347 RepID=UPI001D13820E|nr:SIR2 family protein [Cohnella sp. REN36]MCC3374314.1 SIR2 family protein [Cohnella sp. REN36]